MTEVWLHVLATSGLQIDNKQPGQGTLQQQHPLEFCWAQLYHSAACALAGTPQARS